MNIAVFVYQQVSKQLMEIHEKRATRRPLLYLTFDVIQHLLLVLCAIKQSVPVVKGTPTAHMHCQGHQ